MTISLSSTSNGPDSLSTTFASNTGADTVTVFSGSITSFTNVTGPGLKPFDTVIELTVPFPYDASTGKNLLLDITVPACPVISPFDATNVGNDSVSSVFSARASADTGGTNGAGVIYKGKLKIQNIKLDTNYEDDMKLVSIELNWTTGHLKRSRSISTQVARYGLYAYIY